MRLGGGVLYDAPRGGLFFRFVGVLKKQTARDAPLTTSTWLGSTRVAADSRRESASATAASPSVSGGGSAVRVAAAATTTSVDPLGGASGGSGGGGADSSARRGEGTLSGEAARSLRDTPLRASLERDVAVTLSGEEARSMVSCRTVVVS